jgi:hypothetical protein
MTDSPPLPIVPGTTRLLDATLGVLVSHGVAWATSREIASAAGANLPALTFARRAPSLGDPLTFARRTPSPRPRPKAVVRRSRIAGSRPPARTPTGLPVPTGPPTTETEPEQETP